MVGSVVMVGIVVMAGKSSNGPYTPLSIMNALIL